MEKSRTIKVRVCESCGEDASYSFCCLNCKKDYCYEHKNRVVELPHSVHFKGGCDIYLCVGCVGTHRRELDDIIDAYQKIALLREESKSYWEDFKKRTDIAEKEAKRLYERLK
jgi:hypothetical protein